MSVGHGVGEALALHTPSEYSACKRISHICPTGDAAVGLSREPSRIDRAHELNCSSRTDGFPNQLPSFPQKDLLEEIDRSLVQISNLGPA